MVKSSRYLPLPLTLLHRDCKRLQPRAQAAERSRLWESRYESEVKRLAPGATVCARESDAMINVLFKHFYWLVYE